MVAAGGAGLEREPVELVFPLRQVLRDPLEEFGPLVEGQAAQVRAAHLSRVGEDLGHVQAATRHLGDDIARHGAEHFGQVAARRRPPSANEALESHHDTSLRRTEKFIDRPTGWSSNFPWADVLVRGTSPGESGHPGGRRPN
jgi:hypothetical protein